MPTALDCILLYQHVKDPGGCTVASRVHLYIPYGVSGLLLLWGSEESNLAHAQCYLSVAPIYGSLLPRLFVKGSGLRSWLPPGDKK